MDGDKTDSPVRSQRLGGAEWIRLREEIFSRDGRQCANCGVEEHLQVHHVVPLSRDGTNKRTNLLTICNRCRNRTHNKQTRDRETEPEDPRWLPTIADIRQLVRSTHHLLKRAVIGLLAKTGMGVGEVCNLPIRDVSLPGSSILETYNIDQQNWATDDIPLIRIQVPPKNELYPARRERSETTIVPLDEELYHLIERWLAIRPDAVSRAEPLLLSTGDRWGERLSLAIVHSIVKNTSEQPRFVSKDATTTSVTPYDLRYFFAERFSGRPRIRDYILGRRALWELSMKRVHEEYTRQIYSLS